MWWAAPSHYEAREARIIRVIEYIKSFTQVDKQATRDNNNVTSTSRCIAQLSCSRDIFIPFLSRSDCIEPTLLKCSREHLSSIPPVSDLNRTSHNLSAAPFFPNNLIDFTRQMTRLSVDPITPSQWCLQQELRCQVRISCPKTELNSMMGMLLPT